MMEKNETVLVALSGGVDSSTVAALARDAGCREVICATLLLNGERENPAASAVAEALGMRHILLDCVRDFQERVILPCAEEYARGRTPNPCCLCNPVLKFAKLLALADELGADRVLTGHYAGIGELAGGPAVCRGLDRQKDQSYFLYRLAPEQLARIGFPLGGMEKAQVRELALRYALPTASRPDSQDVCFGVPGESAGETLRRRSGLPSRSGRFLFEGREVGRHDGVHRYTIGQRQGLRVALGVPAYVQSMDAQSGDVTLVTDPRLLESERFLISDAAGAERFCLPDLSVRIRYRSPAVSCRVEPGEAGTWQVIPEHPLRAVTPGQSAVFYQGDLVVGGGIIQACC